MLTMNNDKPTKSPKSTPLSSQHNSDDGFVADHSSSLSSTSSSSKSESEMDSHQEPEPEFFLKFCDLSQQFQKPFQSSNKLRRLRYTCCDVSPNVTPLIVSPARFAALGTTAGSVYLFELFQRDQHFDIDDKSTESAGNSNTSKASKTIKTNEEAIEFVNDIDKDEKTISQQTSDNLDHEVTIGDDQQDCASVHSKYEQRNDYGDYEEIDEKSEENDKNDKNAENIEKVKVEKDAEEYINFNAEHRSTLICEDLIGAVSSLQFAPVQLYFEQVNNHNPIPVNNNHGNLANMKRNVNTFSNGSINNNLNNHHHVRNNIVLSSSSGESELSGNSGNSDNYRLKPGTGTGRQTTGRRASFDITSSKDPKQQAVNNNMRNIFLAIGSSKGDLLIIEFDPVFVSGGNSKFNENSNGSKTSKKAKKQWSVVYKNNGFTKNAISMLRWDNSERLYIADTSGQLFILHDVLEYRQMLILSAPTLLINLNGLHFQQIDVAEKLLIFTTEEQRVFLLNMETSTLSQVGKQSNKQRKKTNLTALANISLGGVCVLANYRLVELNNYFDDDFDSSGERTRPRKDGSANGLSTRAFRLVNTECQLFATRPKCRLWHINQSGDVQFTHQFMELVQSSTPSFTINSNSKSLFSPSLPSSLSNGNFASLYPMYWRNLHTDNEQECIESFVVTWILSPEKEDKKETIYSTIIIINPNEQVIVACSSPLKGEVLGLKCVGNGVFIFYRVHDDSTTLLHVSFLELSLRPPKLLPEDNDNSESLSSSLSLFLSDDDGLAVEENDDDEERTKEEERVQFSTCEVDPSLILAFNLFEQFRFDYLPLTSSQPFNTFPSISNSFTSLTTPRSNRCACNLPLSNSVTQFDMNCVIAKSYLLNDLSADVIAYMAKIAFQAGHWPLLLILLVKIGAVRLYLLIVTLIDCNFLFERLLFGNESQRQVHWTAVSDDLISILFQNQQNHAENDGNVEHNKTWGNEKGNEEKEEKEEEKEKENHEEKEKAKSIKKKKSSKSEAFQISHMESTLEKSIEFYIDEMPALNNSPQATMSIDKLKCSLCSVGDYHKKVRWLERTFLTRALSFCSVEFVEAIVQKVITKLSTQIVCTKVPAQADNKPLEVANQRSECQQSSMKNAIEESDEKSAENSIEDEEGVKEVNEEEEGEEEEGVKEGVKGGVKEKSIEESVPEEKITSKNSNSIGERKSVEERKSMTYFSTQFFLLIYYYQVMNLSIHPNTKQIIEDFSAAVSATLSFP